MIGISAGNHAQALAWGAAPRGSTASSSCGTAPARRRSPRRAATALPSTSTQPIRRGVPPARGADRRDAAARSCTRSTTPLVIAGQGTVALELLEDAPEVETILVPGGGGGLVSGIGRSRADRRVVAVEPERSAA